MRSETGIKCLGEYHHHLSAHRRSDSYERALSVTLTAIVQEQEIFALGNQYESCASTPSDVDGAVPFVTANIVPVIPFVSIWMYLGTAFGF